MTLNRGTPNNSNRKGSIKSLSSQRRASSSTSSTQGHEKGNQEMPETLKGKLLLRNNFTPLDIEKYNLPRKLEIPSIIKEESKAYSSQSRSRSDLFWALMWSRDKKGGLSIFLTLAKHILTNKNYTIQRDRNFIFFLVFFFQFHNWYLHIF